MFVYKVTISTLITAGGRRLVEFGSVFLCFLVSKVPLGKKPLSMQEKQTAIPLYTKNRLFTNNLCELLLMNIGLSTNVGPLSINAGNKKLSPFENFLLHKF